MITQTDIKKIEILKRFINDNKWDADDEIMLLDKLVNNLKIAPLSYRPASKDDLKALYFTCECRKCGWWGSSKFLIGDEDEDCCCPVCGNFDLNEK